MNYFAPGVYIQEESSGVKPIAGVGTSTAAFVGIAEKGVFNKAVLITNWSEFNRNFGGFMPNAYLAYAVYGFFSEGGTTCYAVRCEQKGEEAKTDVPVNQDTKLSLISRYTGEWGDKISVTIPVNFKLILKSGEQPLETYDNVTLGEIETRIKQESSLIKVGVIGDKTKRPENTGTDKLLKKTSTEVFPATEIDGLFKVTAINTGVSVDINKNKISTISTKYKVIIKTGQTLRETIEVSDLTTINKYIKVERKDGQTEDGLGDSSHLDLLFEESQTKGNLTITAIPLKISIIDAGRFDLAVNYDNEVKETFKGVSLQDIPLRLNQDVAMGGSRYIMVEVNGEKAGTINQYGTHRLSGGTTDVDLVGDESTKTGLHTLDYITDINIVAIPDAAGNRDVFASGLQYCDTRKDCFFIGDPPDSLDVSTVKKFREGKETYAGNPFNSSYGALYYPWIYLNVADPVTKEQKLVPPSGVVAGTYAHTDSVRGVHKAPAGIGEGFLDSVVGVERIVIRIEQEQLNPTGVNVIRRLPEGICIWGARTLSNDSEWNYINIRRLLLYLESSIDRATQWVVFEPNEPGLWGRVKRNLTAFLTRVWRDGALFGSTPDEAFIVKVDAENNTDEERKLGNLHIHVGVAPVRPAEFVIIHISQKTMEQQGRS